MVTKGSTAQAAKRKKTEEMADSPPKRVTRARTAKATDDVDLASKSKKPAKATAKAATEKKKAPVKTSATQKKAPATKRKTRADEAEAPIDEPVPDSQVVEESKSKAATSRGGRKKLPAPQEEAESEVVDAPKSRGRQVKAAPAENAKATASTTRGRTKKEKPAEAVIEPKVAEPNVAIEPAKKATRGRAAATTDGPAPKATTKARTTKKVQFQEETDKENVPLQTVVPKKTVKSAMKPSGIQAKPVRKPATTRTTTRGRKAAINQEGKGQGQLPLSPKKVDQVAKAGSASSEDELAGEKTPIRSPSKSPIKSHTSPMRVMNMSTTPTSPSKCSPIANALFSPARRPPPSPFKDGLKMSPKKVNIDFSGEKPTLQWTLNNTPAKPSLLQESPRKAKLENSVARPVLAASQSPVKSSLLQSPARRPITSPFKSPGKATNANTSKLVSPIKLPSQPKPMRFSPQQAVSSPLRVAKSPERVLQVHKITPQGQGPQPIFEAPSPDMADSPGKLVPKKAIIPDAVVDVDEDTTMQDVEHTATSDVQKVSASSSSAFSIVNEALRRVSMESGSTDELASPDKLYAPTPLRKDGVVSQDFATPSTAARAAVIEASNDVSFTPLVGKLGGWSASSPDKQNKAKTSRRTRGMFSLGGATAAALKEESPLMMASPVKTSYFEDELAVMDEELKEAQEVIDAGYETVADGEAAYTAVQSSMESQASEEYGDENAAPTEAEMLREEQDNNKTMTCTPAKVFTSAKVTPAQAITRRPQEIHTVSKVPLRASAEDSALKITRQRSKSMGGSLSVPHELTVSAHSVAEAPLPSQPETPKLAATVVPETPTSGMKLDAETPGRTIRKGVVPDVLKGAIVYVDVHTTEGADASGIFVDLLSQMGARCIKQWNWNPRASMATSFDSNASLTDDSPSSSPSTGRVGITHVVYKDGGQRTLQKVRQSNGVVLCVGVGWVLE